MDIFWQAADQAERLEELTSTDPHLKELPLRRDVRSLGRLLGQVIREQVGEAGFELEERIRLLAIRRRVMDNAADNDTGESSEESRLLEEIGGIIAGLESSDLHLIIKAFAAFFELTNLAETNHRNRRSLAHRVAGTPGKAGSLRATFARMRDAGIDALSPRTGADSRRLRVARSEIVLLRRLILLLLRLLLQRRPGSGAGRRAAGGGGGIDPAKSRAALDLGRGDPAAAVKDVHDLTFAPAEIAKRGLAHARSIC